MSPPAFAVSVEVVEAGIVPAVAPVVAPADEPVHAPVLVEPVGFAEHASPSSSPCTGSPRSYTSAATASAEPYSVVVGAAQQRHPVAEQVASGTAKSEWRFHSVD